MYFLSYIETVLPTIVRSDYKSKAK